MFTKQMVIGLWLSVVVTGCATLSEDECRYADWTQIGFEDGARGKGVLMLAQHRKACAKAGVTPDWQSYKEGHMKGLIRFCTYRNGLNLGERGGKHPDFCPGETERDFNRGYDHGRARFEQHKIIQNLSQSIENLQTDIDQNHKRIKASESILLEAAGSQQARTQELQQMRDLEAVVEKQEARLGALIRKRHREERLLDRLIQQQSDSYQ